MIQPLTLQAEQDDNTQISVLENAVHQDWLVELHQTELTDQSTLSEYVARTNATTSDGSTFTVSFLPRFECEPVISLLIGEAAVQRVTDKQVDLSSASLAMLIDGQTLNFDVIGDQHGNRYRFTYNALSTVQQSLRQALDSGNRMQIQFTASDEMGPTEDEAETEISVAAIESSEQEISTSAADVAYAVSFSLLGSRRAVAMAENSCQHHDPIPFEPN